MPGDLETAARYYEQAESTAESVPPLPTVPYGP